jgi:hypothetical protein
MNSRVVVSNPRKGNSEAMSVYRPKSHGQTSRFYACEFIYQGKRFRESTGATTKTLAKEYEKRRRAELERAAAGLPTEQKSKRVRTVANVVGPYLESYRLTHRPNAIHYAVHALKHITKALGSVLLSDLTESRVHEYIRKRKAEGPSGRTINMELAELSRAIGMPWRQFGPRCGSWKNVETLAGHFHLKNKTDS